MVAPVVVGGQGPFPFIVDTGANRTALSQMLAVRLGLTPKGSGEVHSVYGVATAPIVAAQRLTYGPLALSSRDMPLIDGVVLGGEAGLLGVDSMHDQRLKMDFEQRCIEITASNTPFQHGGWTMVRGQLRFGNLVVVRGTVHGVGVNILIDTGSDSTLANFAFRDRLAHILHTDVEGARAVRAYTMGEPVVLHDALLIPSMMIGGIQIDHVKAYIGDFHIFHVWGLTDEPTLLIGMDVLSQTRAITIDFGHATVYFRLRQRMVTGSRIPGATGAMTITP